MTSSFDDLPWHDATLIQLLIDRRLPGVRDEVCLQVVWPDGSQSMVKFSNCYAMKADLNFGVIADEQIASADVVDDEQGLADIRDRWRPLGVMLEKLRCYRLETSSTASVLRIYAEDYEVV
jgi:hypothetical protein